MRTVGFALALLVPMLATSAAQALPPKLIFEGKVEGVGNLSFEVGYRHQKPFMAEGTIVVDGVTYRLEAEDVAKDFDRGVYFKVTRNDKERKVVGSGVAYFEERLQLTGYVRIVDDQYYIVPKK